MNLRPLFNRGVWLAALGLGLLSARAETFSIGPDDFLLNGEPFQIRCGEMHFARVPREYWANRLRMAHAMGLNTICAYLFWNLQEPAPGKFDFTGRADAAEFCRLAQAEGLHVILRPGPYSCAEWDLGGLPWWLLKMPGIKLRTQDPRYMEASHRYLMAVGKELAPLQVTHGGPIIMVQVENEYGSFGSDKTYMGRVRDDLKEAGFDVPLFSCDGPKQLTNDVRDDLFSVVNIGRKPEAALKTLREVRPAGPLMIGEYYPGWFDSWGEPHHTGSTGEILDEIQWMLDHKVSFSMYMAHGGTTFGFDAGANFSPTFIPEITSYDYDAPISEAGWSTPKFHALRAAFSQHLNPHEQLPEVPAPLPVIEIPAIHFHACAPLFDHLPAAVKSEQPLTFEAMNQSLGAVLYRTEIPAGPAENLRSAELHDYAQIFLNGQRLATLDRRKKEDTFWLPARTKKARLDILVDTFGHVNYGPRLGEFKGITRPVGGTNADDAPLAGWEMYPLPLDAVELGALQFTDKDTAAPAFHRAEFSLEKTGDTFLDVSSWGKGVVWVNGHNLGRYWNIGPQQTLYCPGPWLKTGRNEIVVLEWNGAQSRQIMGRAAPILDQVNNK